MEPIMLGCTETEVQVHLAVGTNLFLIVQK